MLLNLPPEVILSVTRFLNFGDKLHLNATCKKLNDLITKTNLYKVIDLTRHESDTKQIIRKFERKQFKGEQVKVLKLNIKDIPDDMVPQLSSIFPSLTRFTTLPDKNYRAYTKLPTPEPVATWINTLEVYKRVDDWYPMWYALEHHTFPRLTELEAYKENFAMDTFVMGFDGLYLVPFLKNAPNLEKLTIIGFGSTLDFLEKLHASCPHIKSLTLDGNALIIDNDALPEPVVPADSVVCLEIDGTACFDRNGLLLNYILKKYPNLQHLCFIPDHSQGSVTGTLDLYYYPGTQHCFSDSSRDFGLKRDEYKSLMSNFRSTLEVYRNAAPIFFSNLPKTIKSLTVKIEAFDNIIEVLSNSDMKLVELEVQSMSKPLTNSLDKPNQLAYLKYLTSLKTLDISIIPSVQTLTQRFASTSITRLFIYPIDEALHIDWLFSVFPSLEDLGIGGPGTKLVRVGDQSKVNSQKAYPNLRKITLEFVRVQQDVFDFINMVAPNVKELDLTVCAESKSTTNEMVYHLDVCGWNLENFYLDIYNTEGSTKKTEWKIKIEDVAIEFTYPFARDVIVIPGRGRIIKKLEEVIRANIKCDAVKNIIIQGHRVVFK